MTDVKDSSDKSTASILNLLQEPSARRVAMFYDIRNSKGRVGRLCVFKTSFRLGEDIVGLFDFSDAQSQCMQYSVSLYCEEEVKFDQKIKPKVTIKQSFQEFSFGYDEVRKADIHTDILCNLVLDIYVPTFQTLVELNNFKIG